MRSHRQQVHGPDDVEEGGSRAATVEPDRTAARSRPEKLHLDEDLPLLPAAGSFFCRKNERSSSWKPKFVESLREEFGPHGRVGGPASGADWARRRQHGAAAGADGRRRTA